MKIDEDMKSWLSIERREKEIRQGLLELIENIEREVNDLRYHLDVYINLFKKNIKGIKWSHST